MQVAQWNIDRDNTKFDRDLEFDMLAEEAQEFKDGMIQHGKASADEARMDAIVEMVDAWADYRFVLQGTMFKALGSTGYGFISEHQFEQYMFNILRLDFKISIDTLINSYQAVIDANNAKGTSKVNGKIQKGMDWVDPKSVIKGLLDVQGVTNGRL